ncbi:ABC transporter permease [Aquibacillus albus]|uniref:NitT/TauT family transport system permease protein n=1 Tax=Aquibacillus albus TaxID=1168171 RepID=A0ABS2N3I5_9BACI|nr:ABC transporter permease [Aquibacillus albus]MBM7572695.1 NitT/TauT family transport system permease protein [Aquibacillus albus]
MKPTSVNSIESKQTVEAESKLKKITTYNWIFKDYLFKKSVIFPVVFGIVFLFFWEIKVFHMIFNLELYQLPTPITIVQSMIENWLTLMFYSAYTGTEILGGFILGSLLGWIIAMLASLFPSIGKGGVTVIASLNAIPIVALSPIMNNWFGDGIGSRIAIVTISTMAAMVVNAYKGFQSIDGNYLDLMYSYASRKSQIFMLLRFKHSLPYIFAALRINVSASIIAALVGEFFISSKGLGFLLSDQIQIGNMPLAWSCIVIASLMGILFYNAVEVTERLCIPWKNS